MIHSNNTQQYLNGKATDANSHVANNQPIHDFSEQNMNTIIARPSLAELATRAEVAHPSATQPGSGFLSVLKQARIQSSSKVDPREVDRRDRPRTILSVEKASKNDFIRTKLKGFEEVPPIDMIEVKSDPDSKFSKLMWLDPSVEYPREVLDRVSRVRLILYATHQGKFALYPLKETEDTEAEWYTTACMALADAEQEWLQMRWAGSGYRTSAPKIEPTPVDWSKVGEVEGILQDSLRAIRLTNDHPFVRSLLGETITKEDKPLSFLARFKKS